MAIPTPLQQVRRRARRDSEIPGEAFRAWSLAGECALKYCASVLLAALSASDQRTANRLTKQILVGDSLGLWANAIRMAATKLFRMSQDPSLREFATELTRKRTQDQDETFTAVRAAVRRLLGQLDTPDLPFSPSWLGIVDFLSHFRNKTRGHGAYSADWQRTASDDLSAIVDGLVSFLGSAQLAFAVPHSPGDRLFLLVGDAETALGPIEQTATTGTSDAILVSTKDQTYRVVGYLTSVFAPDLSTERYYFANGDFRRADPSAEFIEYLHGDRQRKALHHTVLAPDDLPQSRTAGMGELLFGDEIPHNLPRSSDVWVGRPDLEERLRRALLKQQFPIVTLHGAGGSGKTALALRLAWELAQAASTNRFDIILWMSARDLDLMSSGIRETAREVGNLDEFADLFASLVRDYIPPADSAIATLARELEDPSQSYLIVADNFETFDNPAELQEFLAEKVLPPNKILITSRLREFAADLPIEVGGMDWNQAEELMIRESRDRYCEGTLDLSLRRRIFKATEGRPYPIKLAIAQIAGGISPERALEKLRSDPSILNALFKRSYDLLDPAARYFTLLVGNSGGRVPELLARVAVARRGFRFDQAEDPAVRQALVSRTESPDGERAYSTPVTAALFLRDAMHLSEMVSWVEEDVALVREYRQFNVSDPRQFSMRIAREISQRILESDGREEDSGDLLEILEQIALEQPDVWVHIAEIRAASGESADRQIEALQAGLVQRMDSASLWTKWATIEQERGRPCRSLELVAQGFDASAARIDEILALAGSLLEFLSDTTLRLPFRDCPKERLMALQAASRALDANMSNLDGDGLSKLSWLYLHLNDPDRASQVVLYGLNRFPRNRHLTRIYERLRGEHPGLFGG